MPNPVVYGDMPYFHCELSGGMNRMCFSTADDPFYKAPENKYYPECVVFNANGQELCRINPTNRSHEESMCFCEDFRDPAMKINDDKKICINLAKMK